MHSEYIKTVHIATVALILSFGVRYTYGQERPVRMNFSGSILASTINVAPATSPTEVAFVGNGSLGPFTYSELAASSSTPAPSSTCTGPNHLFFPFVSGAGVFRFRDGSLLTVKVSRGATCVDLSIPEGIATITYQITGGTGRFQSASGTLAVSTTAKPLLFNTSGEPVIFSAAGEFTGTVAF
jgi:hypothetical protein